MANNEEGKTKTVHLGEDGLLAFLQNLYLGEGVETAAKAAGCRVTTGGEDEAGASGAIDDNASYPVSGAMLRQMLETLQAATRSAETAHELFATAANSVEQYKALLDEARDSYNLLMAEHSELLDCPDAYETARKQWLQVEAEEMQAADVG